MKPRSAQHPLAVRTLESELQLHVLLPPVDLGRERDDGAALRPELPRGGDDLRDGAAGDS